MPHPSPAAPRPHGPLHGLRIIDNRNGTATLTVGRLTYRAGQDTHTLAVANGFAEVLPDAVTVLAQIAERAHLPAIVVVIITYITIVFGELVPGAATIDRERGTCRSAGVDRDEERLLVPAVRGPQTRGFRGDRAAEAGDRAGRAVVRRRP